MTESTAPETALTPDASTPAATPATPTTPAALDTQGIKDVLALVIDAAKLGVAAEESGKLSFSDAVGLFKLVPDLAPAIKGMGEVPAELKELGPEAEADLVAFVTERLTDVGSAKATAITSAALKLATAAFGLFQAIRA